MQTVSKDAFKKFNALNFYTEQGDVNAEILDFVKHMLSNASENIFERQLCAQSQEWLFINVSFQFFFDKGMLEKFKKAKSDFSVQPFSTLIADEVIKAVEDSDLHNFKQRYLSASKYFSKTEAWDKFDELTPWLVNEFIEKYNAYKNNLYHTDVQLTSLFICANRGGVLSKMCIGY